MEMKGKGHGGREGHGGRHTGMCPGTAAQTASSAHSWWCRRASWSAVSAGVEQRGGAADRGEVRKDESEHSQPHHGGRGLTTLQHVQLRGKYFILLRHKGQ